MHFPDTRFVDNGSAEEDNECVACDEGKFSEGNTTGVSSKVYLCIGRYCNIVFWYIINVFNNCFVDCFKYIFNVLS